MARASAQVYKFDGDVEYPWMEWKEQPDGSVVCKFHPPTRWMDHWPEVQSPVYVNSFWDLKIEGVDASGRLYHMHTANQCKLLAKNRSGVRYIQATARPHLAGNLEFRLRFGMLDKYPAESAAISDLSAATDAEKKWLQWNSTMISIPELTAAAASMKLD